MKSNLFAKFDCLPRRALALCASLAVCTSVSAFAVTITGSVTNGTTNKPAAGDPVVLIMLDQRMQEIAHAKTDAAGHFSIDAPDPGMHLIRVDHQGAGYFQPAPPNTPSVNVQVFDVAAAVEGIATEANVLRFETDGQGLKVTQTFFIKNASTPPRTQFGPHTYEMYLPPDVRLDGSAAMGPGGMPVQSSPVPLAQKGLYAFQFPLRPGETQFQLGYHLPYSGNLSLSPRLVAAAQNFVVMLPKSMTFKPGAGISFQPLQENASAQTFLVRNVAAGQPVPFTLSGSGQMPRDTAAEGDQGAGGSSTESAASPGPASGSSSADTRPGIGLANPIDTPDPLNKYKWWLLGGFALLFAAAAGLFLRQRPAQDEGPSASELAGIGMAAGIPAPAPLASGNVLLAALKEELFAIETDRMQGRLSETDYGNLKSALELVLRRALNR